MKTENYEAVRSSLKTGDIVLMSGKGLISDGIKYLTGSLFSHIAYIIRPPEFDMVCLLESTTLNNIKDLEQDKFVKGVQLVSMSERLASYKGDQITVRQLVKPLDQSQMLKVQRFRLEIRGRKYEQDKLELVKSVIDLPDWLLPWIHKNEVDLTSLFCSELVAEAMFRTGIIGDNTASNEFVPSDFENGGDIEGHMHGNAFHDGFIIET